MNSLVIWCMGLREALLDGGLKYQAIDGAKTNCLTCCSPDTQYLPLPPSAKCLTSHPLSRALIEVFHDIF
jgi:hypothetical protein